MRPWRLIVDDSPGDGAWNMAVDRAIQSARADGLVGPTLRLYGWKRPTVTLGRFQDPSGVDRGACAANGVDVVRRFTGGRGVLHDDEVTYSVVASVEDGVPRGVAASYRHLCAPLVSAYRLLGLQEAALTRRERGTAGSRACYLHATAADLSVGARKLSGSAQVWMGDVVLQHGSFTLSRDMAREAEVFGLSADEISSLAETTVTMRDLLPAVPMREEVCQAIVLAFTEVFGVTFEPASIACFEVEHARELLPQVAVDPVPQTLDIDHR